MEDLAESLERDKREYGAQTVEESGLGYLAEVYPERLNHFMEEAKFDQEKGSLPRKTLELVLFGACVAMRNRVGSKIHAQGCLTAGATKREILDVLFAAATAASHNITVNILADLKPILEGEVEK